MLPRFLRSLTFVNFRFFLIMTMIGKMSKILSFTHWGHIHMTWGSFPRTGSFEVDTQTLSFRSISVFRTSIFVPQIYIGRPSTSILTLPAPKAWKQIQGEKASTGKTWIWSQQRLHRKLGRFFSRKKRHGRPISEVGKLAVSLWVCAFFVIVFGWYDLWFLWKDTREKYIKFIIHGILKLDVEIFWILTVSYRCRCLSFAILSVWFHTASVPGVCTVCLPAQLSWHRLPDCRTPLLSVDSVDGEDNPFGRFKVMNRILHQFDRFVPYWNFWGHCVFIYVRIHVCVYMYMLIFIYIYICILIYVYIYICYIFIYVCAWRTSWKTKIGLMKKIGISCC